MKITYGEKYVRLEYILHDWIGKRRVITHCARDGYLAERMAATMRYAVNTNRKGLERRQEYEQASLRG